MKWYNQPNQGYWEMDMAFRDREEKDFTYQKMKEYEERAFRNEKEKKDAKSHN